MQFFKRFPRPSPLLLGGAAILAVVLYSLASRADAAFGGGAGGPSAPDFVLETLEGQPLSMQQLRGRVVLVNFWATWCPPCRYEMPGFQRVYQERSDDGFVILGLTTERGNMDRVRAFLAEHGITYPAARATMQVAASFGTPRVLPTSFLIDRQGRIRQRVEGVYDEQALRESVGRLLAENGAAAAAEAASRGGER